MSETEFPKLTVLSEKGRGTNFVLKKLKYSCGRIDSNDIALKDASVSSNHCEFVKRGDTFLVRDLGSTNGVIVNDVSVNDKMLKNNDIIKIGVIELLYEGAETEVSPNKLTIPEPQVRTTVKTGIDLDAFEKESKSLETKNDIFPFANSESKDLKSRLPLIIITTVIILLTLIVLGLLAWFITVFII